MIPAAWPASRSACVSSRAITMWPPSAPGGLEVTTAMRTLAPGLQHRLDAGAEKADVARVRIEEDRREAAARLDAHVPEADAFDFLLVEQAARHRDADLLALLRLQRELGRPALDVDGHRDGQGSRGHGEDRAADGRVGLEHDVGAGIA